MSVPQEALFDNYTYPVIFYASNYGGI